MSSANAAVPVSQTERLKSALLPSFIALQKPTQSGIEHLPLVAEYAPQPENARSGPGPALIQLESILKPIG